MTNLSITPQPVKPPTLTSSKLAKQPVPAVNISKPSTPIVGGLVGQFLSGVNNTLNPSKSSSPINQAIAYGTRNVPKPTQSTQSAQPLLPLKPVSQVQTNPSSPSSPSSPGVRANSPLTNVKPPVNTIQPKFQAEQNTTLGTPSYSDTTGTRIVNPGASESPTGGSMQPQQSSQSSQPGQQGSNGSNGLYGQLISQLQSRAQGDSPEVVAAREALKQSQMEEAKQLGLNANNPIPLEFQQGRAQVLQTQYGQQQQALTGALNSATTTQGQQIGALQGAAGLAQPTSFGLSMDPITGQPINMSAMQVPLQTAMSLYQKGTPLNDPSYAQVLGPVGSAGWMAFYNQLQGGGGINPAAQSAGANQNLAFGTGQQQISQNLSYGLQQLKALQPHAISFLNSSGMNPSNIPVWNTQINSYIANMKNPDTANTWQSIKNDISGIARQILNAKQSAGTPTTQDEMTAAQDPGLLNGQQLTNVMNNWDTLGQIGLGVAQGNAQNILGNNAYVGNPAIQGGLVAGQNQKAFQDPVKQGIGGLFYNILSSPADLARWITAIL